MATVVPVMEFFNSYIQDAKKKEANLAGVNGKLLFVLHKLIMAILLTKQRKRKSDFLH